MSDVDLGRSPQSPAGDPGAPAAPIAQTPTEEKVPSVGVPHSDRLAPPGRSSQWGLIALAAGILIALLYPIPFQMSGQTYFQTVGFLVLLYAMLGVGWNVIGGWCGQFDFGPALFFGAGAYVVAVLMSKVGINPWIGMIAGVLFTVTLCALLTYPITKLRGHYFAIATIAMLMIARPIGQTWEFLGSAQGLSIPLKLDPNFFGQLLNMQFVGAYKAMSYYYLALAFCAATIYACWLVQHSKLGYYFQAIRDDQEGAEAIGINSRQYKVIARCITAAVFAVGGGLYGIWNFSVLPEQVFHLDWGTLPTIAVVLGGIGRLWGPVLGTLILVPLSQYMSTTLGTGPWAGRGIDVIVYGVLIMAVAALRPNGLLSLPWRAWFFRLTGRGAPRQPANQVA